MQLADVTSALSYDELVAVVEDNGQPFESIGQCKVYLRAASMLRIRQPEEIEHTGNHRVIMRDVESQMKAAETMLGILSLTAQPVTVIVPTNNL